MATNRAARVSRSRWYAGALAAVLLIMLPAAAPRAQAANGSLVIAALRVLEQEYVDPIDAVRLLNAATAVLRYGTHLGPDALPEIRPGTRHADAVTQFTGSFSRAAQTGAVPETELAYATTAGMLASLHDSHTYFLDPAALREGRRQLSGRPGFSGIGVVILSREDAAGVRWIFIDRALPGSPASKAGLSRFDKIVEADGKTLRNATAADASDRLRGPSGSTVSLTIERGDKKIKVSVVRAPIVVPPVEARFLKPGVAYLSVIEFSRGAGSNARKALRSLAAQGPIRSLVLDLRGNPGGLIVEAADVGGIFLPARTTLARVVERGAPPTLLLTHGAALFPNVPVAVLVNGGSASGAEIVAGAFKDLQRASIVGEKTAGALGGSIIAPLPEGGMSVTVNRILLPKSGQVEGVGISPTIPAGITVASMERREDPQLQAAVRSLESGRKLKQETGVASGAASLR